jgi:hypothetical protein
MQNFLQVQGLRKAFPGVGSANELVVFDDVNFTINGAEISTSLMPEVSKLVEAKAKQVLSQYVSKNMPEAGQVE